MIHFQDISVISPWRGDIWFFPKGVGIEFCYWKAGDSLPSMSFLQNVVFEQNTRIQRAPHSSFNASRSSDINCAFILLKWTTLTAWNLLGFQADKWSEWGCVGLRVWMWRTHVSAAGVVCRDTWGDEFKNRWVFSLLRVSLCLWTFACTNWTLKSVKIDWSS